MIQTTQQIIDIITEGRQELTSVMLKSLITEHRNGEGHKQKKLWDRYTLEDAPIKHREPANYEKVDRRTANDFFADIVDTKVGYMGNEVTVGLDKQRYQQDGELRTDYEPDLEHLQAWQTEANSEDINSEMVAVAAACGVGYRLLYVPQGENIVKMKNLNPWEVIYIYDQSIDIPQLVLRYYVLKETIVNGGVEDHNEITVVEWYDNEGITYYIDDGHLNFRVNESRGDGGYEAHLFEGIPVIPFLNNGLMTAEPEKVLDLIDAYDAIMSSTTSEIEQLRLAYMFLKGAGIDLSNEYVKQLEQTGIFALPEDGDVGFVNKQLADAPVHNILAEIRRNIYQFAKSIDMSKDFGGNMRVIGWQVALLNLENSSKITERKFIRALRNQYKLLAEYWREYQGADINPMELEFTFNRNFPRDIHAEAETLQLLLSTVSKETAFAQMSFIDDPEEEIAKIDMEESPYGGIDGDEGLEDEQPSDEEGA